MAKAVTIDWAWIAGECLKLVEMERDLAANAKARAESPPDPDLGVLYHEIAAADGRHAGAIETIATRYGHTPVPPGGGGVGETLGWLRDKVTGIGSTDLDWVGQDLGAKDAAIRLLSAWVHVFGAIGDIQSARELSGLLAEERTHHDALQQGFNRLLARRTCGGADGAVQPAPTRSVAAKPTPRAKKRPAK